MRPPLSTDAAEPCAASGPARARRVEPEAGPEPQAEPLRLSLSELEAASWFGLRRPGPLECH